MIIIYRTDLLDEELGVEIKDINKNELKEFNYNKNEGIYYTIKTDAFMNNDLDEMKILEDKIADILKEMIDINKKILVIGLGNYTITPDSLGPRVCDDVIASSHLNDDYLGDVSIISPGVMGQTGMETSDIIKGIVDKMKPDYLIVVDALASRSIKRLNRTIQITNAGINPGSGVGNKRKEISIKTMGIPVIAIGVPTVVDLSSITYDSIEYVLKHLEMEKSKNKLHISSKDDYDNHKLNDDTKKMYLGLIGNLTDKEQKDLINEALNPSGYNYFVTPKTIDENINDLSIVIARGINKAIHKLEQKFQ